MALANPASFLVLLYPGCMCRVGQNHIYTVYSVFGLEITEYTVYIYVYIRFWPTLCMCKECVAHIYRLTKLSHTCLMYVQLVNEYACIP